MKRSLTRILLSVSILISFTAAGFTPSAVSAQSGGLYYVVQQDDSLYSISQSFHTSTARLQQVNDISDPDMMDPGTRLLIPGFGTLSGTLTSVKIAVGDTPHTLLRSTRSDASTFNRINFLTSEDTPVVGQKLFLLASSDTATTRIPVTDGGLTGLELAAQNNVNPWTAAEFNSLSGPWYLIPNDTLFLPASATNSSNEILPGISDITVSSLGQGKTAVITAKTTGSSQLSSTLNFTIVDTDKEEQNYAAALNTPTAIPTPSITLFNYENHALNFFTQTDGSLEALQGVPRMTVPGFASLIMTAKTKDGKSYSIQQNVKVKKVDYGYDYNMQVADNFVDPKVTEPEQAFLLKTVLPASNDKLFDGAFKSPTSTPDCTTDTYGKLRAFNGSDYIYWHSGIDYCGANGGKIFAVADGTVVYTGELTVRGNATIIDHGHGVYTAYYHQSKIEVTNGQKVKAGDEIGLIGATGRVTGPHLHLDVIVGDVQVDPTEWLKGLYP